MSESGENIDDLIRGGFDSPNDDFDFGSWSEVKQKLDGNAGLDQQILQAFDRSSEELPATAWPDIKEALDIDTVWGRIAAKMTKKKRRAFFWWNAAAAGIIILIATYIYQDKFSSLASVDGNDSSFKREISNKSTIDKEPSFNVENNHQSDLIENASDIQPTSENTTLNLSQNQVNSNNYSLTDLDNANISTINNLTNNISENSTTIGINLVNKNTNKLSFIKPLDFTEIKPLNQSMNVHPIPQIEIKPLEKKKLHERKWIVGAFASLDHSILSDATTREAFSANSLTSNNFTLSLNYGVYGQLYLKNNYLIQSEFFWNSRTKRSTQEYNHFEYTNHIVELDYFKFTLAAGKSIPLSKNQQTWFNPSVGGFVSYLKRGNEYYESTLISHDTHHKFWDYGLRLNLGIQHEFNRFVLGYGINSSIGLSNIFEGTDNQSSFLNVSKTYTNGAYLRLGFKI